MLSNLRLGPHFTSGKLAKYSVDDNKTGSFKRAEMAAHFTLAFAVMLSKNVVIYRYFVC